MLADRNTQIGTLRVRCASKDNLSLRLALASLLNSAELKPRGVPPSSVLIVRNMADPLPGQLDPHRQTVRVDTLWEKAVQDSLSENYRRAARPKKGYLLTGSEAVLFADEGEMLACLILDISRGDAQRHWWWSRILHTSPSLSSRGLTMLLSRKAIYVPAVIHHLVEWQQAVKVVTTLSSSQIMSVLSAMCKEYDLADFGAVVFYPKELPRDDPSGIENHQLEKCKPQPMTIGLKASKEEKLADARPLQAAAPWEQWYPPEFVPPDLTRERACLLGLALGLYHHPIEVRSDIFLQSVHDWWMDAQVTDRQMKEHTFFTERDTNLHPGQNVFDSSREGTPSKENISELVVKKTATDNQLSSVLNESNAENNFPRIKNLPSVNPHDFISQKGVEHPTGKPKSTSTGDQRAKKETDMCLEEGVVTKMGGLLYLINLMKHLNLPACFEEEWGLANKVGSWGVLELLGRSLLGQDNKTLAKDPMWRILASLDGREPDKLPGEAFLGGNSFRLPKQWLDQTDDFKNSKWNWAAKYKRLRLWSEKRFLLIDIPHCSASPLAQAKDELKGYSDRAKGVDLLRKPFDQAPVQYLSGYFIEGLNSNLIRWLSMVMSYIRFRLNQALNQGSSEEINLAKALILYQGRLYVTATHVDLVINLNDISLPIRKGGLDFDPGWIPEFSRVVKFCFE